MGWTAPKVWASTTLASADMNTYISDDLTYLKSQTQVLPVNVFTCPAPGTDWTPELNGAGLAASLATKKCWLPLNMLQQNDIIVSYKLVGDATEAAALTLDCKLVTINKADPITNTDVVGGDIVQVDANGNFDVEATLTAGETVATDKQYALEILGTCGIGDSITVMGAEVTITRVN